MNFIKRLIILFVILGGVYLIIPKEIFYDSPNIKLGSGKVFYKNKLFTGKLLKNIPLINKTISIDCRDGSISSFPTTIDKNTIILEIPIVNKFIKYNSKSEKLSERVSIIMY